MLTPDVTLDARVVSLPWKRLFEAARREEELLLAIRAAVLRGDEGKDEVFRLAAELTRDLQRGAVALVGGSIQPIPRVLAENCSGSPGSAFLKL